MNKYFKISALIVCWLSACGGSLSRNNNSETHFLRDCEEECGDGFSCVCGVCTVTCNPALSCGELHPNAVCRTIANAKDLGCAESSSPSVCDVGCNSDTDCRLVSSEHQCVSGFCRLPGCIYQGQRYARGETFSAPGAEDCNTCSCGDDGEVLCTRSACEPEPPSCEYDGATYAPGDSFLSRDACNSCTCTQDGQVTCTTRDCSPATCDVDGVSYAVGDSFSIDCNACACLQNGEVACDDRDCTITCELDGELYHQGDAVPASDCNSCFCDADGVVCTARDCAVGCEFNGQFYEVGSTFPADDACNTCNCIEEDVVGCTQMACGPRCEAPFEAGPCFASMEVYWHNPQTGNCEPNVYGGCGGNNNRFDTEAQCQAVCQ